MFASQLLRILHTVPADVNYETCAFDRPDPKLTMKQNQIEILYQPNSYQGDADLLAISSCDSCQKNDSGRKADTLTFGIQDEHEFWNTAVPKSSEVLDNCTKINDDEIKGTHIDGDPEGVLHHLNGCESGGESLASYIKDNGEIPSSPELVHSVIVDEFTHCNKNGSGDSQTSCCTLPQLFKSDVHSYTDKNVVECELPEFVVCYRESNLHTVKDICVDVGVPTQERTLIDLSQLSNENQHIRTTKGDIEVAIPDLLRASSVENDGDNCGNECGTREVDPLFVLDKSESISEDSAEKNGPKVFCPGNLHQMDEVNRSTTDKTLDGISEGESAISSTHFSQESIVQDSLVDSSNCNGNEVAQSPDEVPSIEAILESLAVVFTSEESKKDGLVSKLCYNSKVESGTITFDFNSSKPAVASSMNESAEATHGKSADLDDGKLGDQSASNPVQCANILEKVNEKVHDPNPLREDVSNDENGNSGSLLVSSQLQRGNGESSFSAPGPVSGLITYSGPIAYSGSISLRSDSSTTSARSFAFPILQSEWNSSPVRMQKADRRPFRKHRGWMHGLFCCRF